uniref:Uncharacterized protein n=1 Tax=Setaria viridis TaxID=4556 RepID=A0A4V6DCQ4_SETVI|nr:hypothetical protein SEVIR_1G116150v2 [Setaria viridis]
MLGHTCLTVGPTCRQCRFGGRNEARRGSRGGTGSEARKARTRRPMPRARQRAWRYASGSGEPCWSRSGGRPRGRT